MDSTTLFIGILAGAIGVGYFAYGKRQRMYVPMLAGVALMVYPYFLSSVWALVAVGVLLAALPFFLKA